jgi:hypothetical protein
MREIDDYRKRAFDDALAAHLAACLALLPIRKNFSKPLWLKLCTIIKVQRDTTQY